MGDRVRCACRSCTVRGLMGPAIIITVGVLFLLDQTSSGNFSFGNTYPVILIVIGMISLAAAVAPRAGHISRPAPPLRWIAAAPAQLPGSRRLYCHRALVAADPDFLGSNQTL